MEIIEDPDVIVMGTKEELIVLHHHKATSISDKHVVAVYREFKNAGFLITAFMTSAPETILRKGIIWRRPRTS